MKAKEAVFYLGMMLATGGTYLVLKQAGIENHLVRLIIAVLVGSGVGYLSERVYSSRKKD
jgi:hypothetical protein